MNKLSLFAKDKLISRKNYKSISNFIKDSKIFKNLFANVCSAWSIPNSEDFQTSIVYHFQHPELKKPLFYNKDAQGELLKESPPSETSYPAGIISVSDICVSFPYPVHRWKGKVFVEGLRGTSKFVSEPRYLIALETIPFAKKTKMPEGVLLAMPSLNNYYHWLVEILPRLRMVEEDERLRDLPLIMPKNKLAKYVYDSLKITGYFDKVNFLDDGVYQFEKLHIPTLFSPPCRPSPLAIEWLRNHFLTETITKGKRRIYVSRRDSAERYVSNEVEVEELLSEFGFETICPGNYSLEEQVKIFQEAEMIIGSHGAAFANLAFTPSESVFIELFRKSRGNPVYRKLAAIRNLKYGVFVCQEDNAGQYVDINGLREVVEKAVATLSETATQ